MDIPTHADLLDRIETFCTRHDIAETRFGREAVNNPNFLSGLRREPPVSPTLDTLNKVRDFMERLDSEARIRARTLELAGTPLPEEEMPLPFQPAPVKTTGASSPISSSTIEPPTSSAATASCQACSSTALPADTGAKPNPSCSAEDVGQIPQAAAPLSAQGDAGAGHQLPTRPGANQEGE